MWSRTFSMLAVAILLLAVCAVAPAFAKGGDAKAACEVMTQVDQATAVDVAVVAQPFCCVDCYMKNFASVDGGGRNGIIAGSSPALGGVAFSGFSQHTGPRPPLTDFDKAYI